MQLFACRFASDIRTLETLLFSRELAGLEMTHSQEISSINV